MDEALRADRRQAGCGPPLLYCDAQTDNKRVVGIEKLRRLGARCAYKAPSRKATGSEEVLSAVLKIASSHLTAILIAASAAAIVNAQGPDTAKTLSVLVAEDVDDDDEESCPSRVRYCWHQLARWRT